MTLSAPADVTADRRADAGRPDAVVRFAQRDVPVASVPIRLPATTLSVVVGSPPMSPTCTSIEVFPEITLPAPFPASR